MADSRAYLDAEDWICEQFLPNKFNRRFARKRLKLRSGGKFEFDAVSDDNNWVISISTNGGISARGRKAMPKLNKIRSDALFRFLPKQNVE